MEHSKLLILVIFLFLVSLISALYGFPVLDEGFFIQISKSTFEGAKLYVDIPGMYGPLFFKINELFFSTFGFLHFTSRLGAFSLGLMTFLILGLCIQKANKGFVTGTLIFPGIWFLASSQRFNESLHPGWYIALILAVQAYLVLSESKHQYIGLGICSGLLMGFKPHIALLGVTAVLQIIVLRDSLSLPRVLRYIPLLLLSLFAFAILQAEISISSASYLLPYCFSLILFFISLRSYQSDKRFYLKDTVAYITPLTLVTLCTYLVASYYFGFQNMKYSMFDLPRLSFPDLYKDQHILPFDYQLCIYSLYIYVFVAIGLSWKKSINRLIYILPLGLTQCSLLFSHIFFLTHVLLYFKFFSKANHKYTSLLLLSLTQIFHLHPIAGTQVYYASPIIWLLLALNFAEDIDIDRSTRLIQRASIISILLFTFLNTPVVKATLRGENLVLVSTKIDSREHIIVEGELSKMMKSLLDYLRPKLTADSTLLTIPRYDSINLFLNISPPNAPESHYLMNMSEDRLYELSPSLFSSQYIIIFPKSNRAKGILDSEIFKKVLMEKYDLIQIDSDNISDKEDIQILKRKN